MEFKCHNCGYDSYREEKVNKAFDIEGKLYYIVNIPAKICNRCEQSYFSPEVYDKIYKTIYNPSKTIRKIETDVMEFA